MLPICQIKHLGKLPNLSLDENNETDHPEETAHLYFYGVAKQTSVETEKPE